MLCTLWGCCLSVKNLRKQLQIKNDCLAMLTLKGLLLGFLHNKAGLTNVPLLSEVVSSCSSWQKMRAIHGCCCYHYRWFLNYLIERLPLPSTIYSSCLRRLWEPFIYKTLIICFLFNRGIINHLIAMLMVFLDVYNMFDVSLKEGYISYDPSHPCSIKVNRFSCGWSP